MSTIKNGEVGTLDTMDQMVWDETKDLQYYKEVHGDAEGTQGRREFMIGCIDRNLIDYIEVLDRAIRFLWKQPHNLDAEGLSLLSVDGKIELLRKLILVRSNEIPIARRLGYLGRFEDDLTRYAEVEKLRNKVLRRYLVEPSGTWLRELVDADDWIVTAWFDLDESMSCEHEGYVRLITSRRGGLHPAGQLPATGD
jgi:hypothetical protein